MCIVYWFGMPVTPRSCDKHGTHLLLACKLSLTCLSSLHESMLLHHGTMDILFVYSCVYASKLSWFGTTLKLTRFVQMLCILTS